MGVSNDNPPGWALKFLEWFCPAQLYESVAGDLIEQYAQNRNRKSKARADLIFILNTLRFFKPAIIRRSPPIQIKISMITNYLKIAIRNLRLQWMYSTINIGSLTLGMICCSMVSLFVYHELSYDNFHFDAENTYRIAGDRNNQTWFPTISMHYSDEVIGKEFSGIKYATRFRRTKAKYVEFRDTKVSAGRVFLTDPGTEFFKVFNFNFTYGSSEYALKNAYEAVIVESLAKRLFGETDPVNSVIKYDTLQLKVTGVIEEIPSNSHLDFTILASNPQGVAQANAAFTYVTLIPGSKEDFTSYLYGIPEPSNTYRKVNTFELQPLKSIHMNSNYTYELEPPGNVMYLYVFSTVGLIILLIACTNYMNLSIAVYSGRRTEIAIRKVIGGRRMGLASQFLTESLLVSVISLAITLILLNPLINIIKNLTEISLDTTHLYSPLFIGILVSITLFASLLAGSYPALVLPRISILKLFRAKSLSGNSGVFFRKLLVTIQLTLLIGLGAGAFFVNKQLSFIQQKNLGFAYDGVIKIKQAWDLGEWMNYIELKTKLLANPDICYVTNGLVPGDEDYGFPFKTENNEVINLISYGVDLDYFETLQIKRISGEFWNLPSDERPDKTILINETFATKLGYNSPVGRTITFNPGAENERDVIINGVFQDFNFFSLHEKVSPMMITVNRERIGTDQSILIRAKSDNLRETLSHIEKTWAEIVPSEPLNLGFMEDDLQEFYQQDRALGKFSLILSVIAMLLAIGGLTGLSSYLAGLRIKEIGVRKVLGASVLQILKLLSKELIILIFISIVISTMFSYFLIDNWLNNFAFQISLSVWVFPLVGISALILALLAMGVQSLKAASSNPVNALRSE